MLRRPACEFPDTTKVSNEPGRQGMCKHRPPDCLEQHPLSCTHQDKEEQYREPRSSRDVLAHIVASRDADALEREGGVSALANIIAGSISRQPSNGARLLHADEYAATTEAVRRRVFGSNRMRKWITLKGANFFEFFLEELQQETVSDRFRGKTIPHHTTANGPHLPHAAPHDGTDQR